MIVFPFAESASFSVPVNNRLPSLKTVRVSLSASTVTCTSKPQIAAGTVKSEVGKRIRVGWLAAAVRAASRASRSASGKMSARRFTCDLLRGLCEEPLTRPD